MNKKYDLSYSRCDTLYKLLAEIGEKPHMFMHEPSLSGIEGYINGFLIGKRLSDEEATNERVEFHGFNAFVAEQLGVKMNGKGWQTMLPESVAGNQAAAFDRFFELLELYKSREGSYGSDTSASNKT